MLLFMCVQVQLMFVCLFSVCFIVLCVAGLESCDHEVQSLKDNNNNNDNNISNDKNSNNINNNNSNNKNSTP